MIAGADLLLGTTCAFAAALSPACTREVFLVLCCRATYNTVCAKMPHTRAVSLARVFVSAVAAACCSSIVSKLAHSDRLVPGWISVVPASILFAYKWGLLATLPVVAGGEYIAWRFHAWAIEAPRQDERVDIELAVENGRFVVIDNSAPPANVMNRMSSALLESTLPRQVPALSSTCDVCAEPVVADGRVLACNHVFHADCADSWFMLHSSCPFCDTSIIRLI